MFGSDGMLRLPESDLKELSIELIEKISLPQPQP